MLQLLTAGFRVVVLDSLANSSELGGVVESLESCFCDGGYDVCLGLGEYLRIFLILVSVLPNKKHLLSLLADILRRSVGFGVVASISLCWNVIY